MQGPQGASRTGGCCLGASVHPPPQDLEREGGCRAGGGLLQSCSKGQREGRTLPPRTDGQAAVRRAQPGPAGLGSLLGGARGGMGGAQGSPAAPPPPSPRQQCSEAWAAGKGEMTSLPPGICCLEASPWRPEGSGPGGGCPAPLGSVPGNAGTHCLHLPSAASSGGPSVLMGAPKSQATGMRQMPPQMAESSKNPCGWEELCGPVPPPRNAALSWLSVSEGLLSPRPGFTGGGGLARLLPPGLASLGRSVLGSGPKNDPGALRWSKSTRAGEDPGDSQP
ncbi:hypothetical protein AAY473_025590 [Plecturocebus cupreus]